MNNHNQLSDLSNNPLSIREKLHQTALKAPEHSGVYMWRNEEGTVIYVGKAKNLKHRLTSYFNPNKDIKTRTLVGSAASIEYITTSNEYEAFLLENNLIKKYSPRYNICLKDGKSYPVLKITREEFPRVYKTRNVRHDGSLYFGPFPDVHALDTFIEAIYEIYPLRQCKRFSKKSSPCMYYHIGRCKAPCCKKIENSTYNEFIEEIKILLENKKNKDSKEKIVSLMKQAACELNFEKAARLRDGLKALDILTNQNIVEGFDGEDRDYIASFREGELVSFTVLKIRGGKLLGRDNYRTMSMNEDFELVPEFMSAYYTEKDLVPPRIFIKGEAESDLIDKWFSEKLGASTRIIFLKENSRSVHRAALNMAEQNAHEDIIRRLRDRGDFPAMNELKSLLELPSLPVRIEGFDIAHIGGKFPVASLISFYNGNPDKKNYRYFRLKTTDGIIDDFASMKEATSRRYTRLLNEKSPLPDLILIDGGIGQVNAVKEILDSLGLDIPMIGLAEKNEEIYKPGNSKPIVLPRRSDALRLLQRVRDETHRFATSRNQALRTKENIESVFLKIRGIGPKRDAVLLKEYGTLKKLVSSSPSELSLVLKIPLEEAMDVMEQASRLYENECRTKETQMLSLEIAGTTKEKSMRYKINHDLASSALMVSEDDECEKNF